VIVVTGVALVALVAVVGFAVFALRVQREALERVLRLWAEQSAADANERHVLANRIQRPEVLQLQRQERAGERPVQHESSAFALAGADASHLTPEEFERDFGEELE
jgi:hypothetical protein